MRAVLCSALTGPEDLEIADIEDTKTPRGLDRALFQKLAAGQWIERHQNLLIIGKTEPAS